MIANQRHLFDIPEGVAYLDCAARTPLLKASKAAGEAALARELRSWSYNPDQAPPAARRTRR